jgi:hypothetical protein
MATGKGTITFSNQNTNDCIEYPLIANNGLWFYEPPQCTDIQHHMDFPSKPIIQRLTAAGQYKLHHARLGHPGERIMQSIHHHVDGINKLINPLCTNAKHVCSLKPQNAPFLPTKNPLRQKHQGKA